MAAAAAAADRRRCAEHGPDQPEAGDHGLLRLQPGRPDRQPRRSGLAQMILRLGQLAVTI
jgi:hypothetical protein